MKMKRSEASGSHRDGRMKVKDAASTGHTSTPPSHVPFSQKQAEAPRLWGSQAGSNMQTPE